MRHDSELEFYDRLAREIVPQGFRCFKYDDGESVWLHIITPNNSWLYVDGAEFYGYNIAYEYVPSRDFGSGCRYNVEPLTEITAETLLNAEIYGKNYDTIGYELCPCCGGRKKVIKKPEHYSDALKAIQKSWCASKLTELYMEGGELYVRRPFVSV